MTSLYTKSKRSEAEEGYVILYAKSKQHKKRSVITKSKQPKRKHVISTGAADGSIVRCAVERPLHFAFVLTESRSRIPQPPNT